MATNIDLDKREKEAYERIQEFKHELGDALVILGHHYQRLQIIELSDHIGDSFALAAKAAASRNARHIVFCGVKFMAESAEVLSTADQTVYHPNPAAGCPMADMAGIDEVEIAFEHVSRHASGKVIPLVYMNSSVDVKAFCGRNNGLVCTSSNATAAMEWAFRQGRSVLFFPDEHLAANTADSMDIPPEARTLYDPGYHDGGEEFQVHAGTRLIQWKGYFHVHTDFKPEHVARARSDHPGCIIVVHPECPSDVTRIADEVGSTTKIVKTVAAAPEGSTVIVGTEINLVDRLAMEQAGSKRVLPLKRSFCPNMFRINLSNLCATLGEIGSDRYVVTVPSNVARDARTALQRMLDLS